MLSIENKPPTFNNLMSKETLYMYVFCPGDLDLEQVTLAKNKENQTQLRQLITNPTFMFKI